MKLNKKITMGALAAVAVVAPIATVVSCGSEKTTKQDKATKTQQPKSITKNKKVIKPQSTIKSIKVSMPNITETGFESKGNISIPKATSEYDVKIDFPKGKKNGELSNKDLIKITFIAKPGFKIDGTKTFDYKVKNLKAFQLNLMKKPGGMGHDQEWLDQPSYKYLLNTLKSDEIMFVLILKGKTYKFLSKFTKGQKVKEILEKIKKDGPFYLHGISGGFVSGFSVNGKVIANRQYFNVRYGSDDWKNPTMTQYESLAKRDVFEITAM